jgi:DNA-binding beta-propeller fold protein YncE
MENQVIDATFDSIGNLYVINAGSNTITKITPDGTSSIFDTNANQPTQIVFDSMDNLYVMNSGDNTITKITPDGISSIVASVAGTKMVIDSSGNIYVSNNTGIITKIASSEILSEIDT